MAYIIGVMANNESEHRTRIEYIDFLDKLSSQIERITQRKTALGR